MSQIDAASGAMLPAQRRDELLRRLAETGQLSVADIAGTFGVSEDTARRDLDELAAEGLLRRVHGGAVPVSAALGTYQLRQTVSSAEKARIGARAAQLVRPGQVVLVDGGTTARELVRALPLSLSATIVTHSPTIAAELIDHTNIEVLILGGRLFRHSMVAVGDTVLSELGRLHADLFFLGATGIHPEAGATTGNWEEAAVKRRMCQAAAETWLLVSPEKLGAVGPHVIVPAADLGGLVVPAELAGHRTRAFEELGLKVVAAEGL